MLRVVLTDANVLYSRVLRDYILYAAEYQIISVAWSRQILLETTGHLMVNRPSFDQAAADALIGALGKTFPYAERNPGPEHFEQAARLELPDEDDRHVIAAAIAAEADVVCTANITDFPVAAVGGFGFTVLTPDELICQLITSFPAVMLLVHQTSIANLRGASNESTLAALRKSGAPQAADMIARLLASPPGP
jgi:predicted nucleic acid-binding protein